MTTTCPTCRRPFPPPEPTPERPLPLADHRLELLQRLASDGRLTARTLAQHLFQPTPTRSQLERARAVLNDAVDRGVLRVLVVDKEHVYLPPVRTRQAFLELLTATQVQTARSAACHVFGTDKPKPAELERARRRLEALVTAGQAVRSMTATGEVLFHPVTTTRPATG
jgi:hypothetical protein